MNRPYKSKNGASDDRVVIDAVADQMIDTLYKNLFETCLYSEGSVDELLKSAVKQIRAYIRRVEQIRTALHKKVKE